jgi:hypothetical protein
MIMSTCIARSQWSSSGMSSIRSDVIVDVVISSSSDFLAGSYTSTTAIASTGPLNQRNYRQEKAQKPIARKR